MNFKNFFLTLNSLLKYEKYFNLLFMVSHNIQFRIRYAETDQMGVVHHGNYAQFLEMGRIEWLRNLGFSYKKMEEENIILPVISMTLNFKKSATYDDLIQVTTKLTKMPSVKIVFDYEIHNEKGELLTVASTTLAFINNKLNKPIRCPKALEEKIDSLWR